MCPNLSKDPQEAETKNRIIKIYSFSELVLLFSCSQVTKAM